MKISPALSGTTLTGVGIYALSGWSPWMLLVLIVVVLTAVLGFVYSCVRWPQRQWTRLLELIRTLQGR